MCCCFTILQVKKVKKVKCCCFFSYEQRELCHKNTMHKILYVKAYKYTVTSDSMLMSLVRAKETWLFVPQMVIINCHLLSTFGIGDKLPDGRTNILRRVVHK